MWAKSVTIWLIAATVAVWICWDVVAFKVGGGDATESVTLGDWFWNYFWVAIAMGAFVGHIIRSGPQNLDWRHWVAFLASAALGYFATALTR